MLEEIEELEIQSQLLNDISNKIITNKEVSEFMSKNLDVGMFEINCIAQNLTKRATQLKEELYKCEVDIDVD